MTCYSHTNPIPEIIFFLIQIPTPIPIRLIPIQIPGFTKIHDNILFANDTITYCTDSQPHLSIITLVNKWCQAIKLVINYTVVNTRQVIFRDSKKTVNLEETLNMGQSLLEINIETSINFKSHLKSLRKKNLNFL